MVGTWIGKATTTDSTIDGSPVTYDGANGQTWTFNPDGTGDTVFTFRKVEYTVYQDNVYALRWQGGSTFHWRTKDGYLLISHNKGHGETQVLENGNVIDNAPLSQYTGPLRAICVTSNILTLRAPDSLEDLGRSTG
jgi:hypothetical protein